VRKLVKRKGLPEWGEIVLVTVQRITPYAAWCKLEEYPNIEGMIHVSEVSGKWVHDIREFVKLNKQYVAKVVKIDYQKNFINLSLKRVSRQDEKQKMNFFRREQRAEKMLEQSGNLLGKDLDQSYEEVGFLLQEKFGEMFVAFESAKKSKDELTKEGIPQEWADVLTKIAGESFQEKEVVIKADLDLKSFAADGIEKIKDVLAELNKKTGANIKYISAPKYRIELQGKDPKQTEKKLVEGLETVVKQIKQFEGEGTYKLIK
jgi:translation initiation factor 2 subunit 1